ncbi:Ras GTPase-activating-like protein IQGAP2/3 [Geosmithia morbida]|uniref:Ras GTPase-activating-like protein IQGAP2/3 n=1 Tax=Geosmithia morbida TaxID=1094350 RepID=A0A9P5CZL4_9HYPO|nr:Ras GTPase-activating-like protein IQGAP2/3 [Geosmithia morbida]KAF4121713.1 Ras GTPase-activating-like protein IQGAP2/3 [Geosmithia morbida]
MSSYRPLPPRPSQIASAEHSSNINGSNNNNISNKRSSFVYPSSTVAAAINRFPSTTSSSASSGYSDQSQLSGATSSVSSTPSQYHSYKHKRGQSDVLARARTFELGETMRSPTKDHDGLYASARQSLRPLPQAPVAASPTPPAPSTPPHRKQSNGPSPGLRRERGQSVDLSKLSLASPSISSPESSPERPLSMRPNSMLMTRSDSIRIGGSPGSPSSRHHHSHSATQIGRPELERLSRSATSQLRTLSRLTETEAANGFNIASPAQQVAGLRGRRRLQRTDKPTEMRGPGTGSGYGWEGRNWMDKQRQFLQAYEYLCHIGEAKEWIEDIIHKTLPPIVELEEALRDGVTLAEVVQALNPDRYFRIFYHKRLQYRHSDNIDIFFRYLNEVNLPDLFRFETIDLYEKKNIPKVIYCIHALSWLLFRLGIVDFCIGNLVGQLEFEHHELEEMQKGLDKLGVGMPSFGNMGADFGVAEPEPEPEPQETEQERVDRELGENEASIVDFQAQIRGAMVRLRLGDTMQVLWDEEPWLLDLQARIRGDFTRQVMGYRIEMRRFATNLQKAARGFLLRKRLQKSDRLWKALEPNVLELQSMIRASKARNEVRHLKSSLKQCSGPVRDIQALSRGFLARKSHVAQHRAAEKMSSNVQQLQAVVRGMLARNAVSRDLHSLEKQAPNVARLQAVVRAQMTRDRIALQKEHLEAAAPAFTTLQAFIRGQAARAETQATRAELQRHTPEATQLQSAVRAGAVRREIAEKKAALKKEEPFIQELQGAIRGMLSRESMLADMKEMEKHTPFLIDLQGRIRGYLYRRRHEALMEELQSHYDKFASFQAILRGIMERGRVGDLLADLEEEEPSIVELQSAVRGFLVRAKFEEKRRFFNENMQKVIKIQSFVRAKVQGEAYKSLTTGKNPPVNAVKSFVHLLNDSDFDFNEEVEFERMRKTVVQQVRQNEMLEQYIDQLDIKIALLVKNKITLDEVVRHQHNFGGHSMGLLANSTISSTNQFDLKALNKSSRRKLELYQQLFFNLQTQPQYLGRLFRRIREQAMPEKDSRRIELLIMSLFGYAQKRREEYYLLKLVARSIWEEVEGFQSLQDYQRCSFFWAKLLGNYTRSPRDRKYLRDLLGPLIRDNIVEDPALDLESDPMQIYRSAINNEELRTGRPDPRPLDVPREVAIRDPETRRLFIDHLRDLREICDQFLLALEDLLHKMPYGLRFLGGQMFQALSAHFKREAPELLLQTVSNWIWRFYLQPALMMPENVGVIEKGLSPLQKRNLGEVAKVVGQIASGRVFGGDNIYLQPLNAFISESIERLTLLTRDLISVADAESTFDIDEFNDLYAKNKPTLYIKLTDVFAIHNLVAAELSSMCPNRDDVLREIMHDLGSAKSNENEMMSAAGTSEINMFLTPKLHDIEDPEAEVKALFMETKRCVLYIIRVQTGDNLLDILVKPILDEDEAKWRALLHDDFADSGHTRGAYSETNMVDVTRMSYYELKRTALENVMRLEQMGRISKKNFYQDVLNAIAVDIRSKSRRRVQRQRELEGVRMTLSNLHDKAKYLEQQRKSYDNYIESAMATLQSKKGKKRFLLPFTKQYNHQRELERSGRVPKFGSYKYSARALSDKGVLVSWEGVTDRDWEKINLTISCDEVGLFSLEGSRGSIQMPGAIALVPIEDLLQAQFEAHQFMNLFEGNLRLNVNLLLHLLYKKFYRTQ